MTTLPLNQILQGNCVEILNSLPENSVDLVFADPPYNLQLQNDLYRPDLSKVDAVNNKWDKFSSFAEYDLFTREWLSATQRVMKETGTIWVIGSYHNIFRVGAIMQDLDYWILNDIIWLKANPMPNFRGVRFTNAHETMIWAQKKKGAKYIFNHHAMKKLNDDLQMRSDWVLPLATGRERIKSNGSKAHPTQKPESLLYRVMISSSNVGDVILDPFFGSGTTGAVAKKLGRNYIGIERDKKYVKIAQKRIDAVEKSPLAVLTLPEKRNQVRVPFGALLEAGFLSPGQSLFFKEDKSISVVILSNGHLKYKEQVGSIHALAKAIAGGAVNGWDMWLYKENGKLKVIDELREKIRTPRQGDMQEIEINLSGLQQQNNIEEIIEIVCAEQGLHLVSKNTLQKYSGCVHWHYQRIKTAGTLEITYWPAKNRCWFPIRNGRAKPWVVETIEQLRTEIERQVKES